MKVLFGAFDRLHLGWGTCDQAEMGCVVGVDFTIDAGTCKTLTHPNLDDLKYDMCYLGPGHW